MAPCDSSCASISAYDPPRTGSWKFIAIDSSPVALFPLLSSVFSSHFFPFVVVLFFVVVVNLRAFDSDLVFFFEVLSLFLVKKNALHLDWSGAIFTPVVKFGEHTHTQTRRLSLYLFFFPLTLFFSLKKKEYFNFFFFFCWGDT